MAATVGCEDDRCNQAITLTTAILPSSDYASIADQCRQETKSSLGQAFVEVCEHFRPGFLVSLLGLPSGNPA